ncbi:MAG: flagellar motor switch phosphatase FliY [Thermoleophilia bacterium]
MSEGGSLSQEEIDALLTAGPDAEPNAEEPAATAGAPSAPADEPAAAPADEPVAAPVAAVRPDLDESVRDAIGEVGNICMSSAATTLSLLLSRPVQITTPLVEVVDEEEVRAQFNAPAVIVSIDYTEGLDGRNVFLLSIPDASVVADLMMGGEGTPSDDLSELHTSATAEAMNQMMGSASTAMAEMVGRRIDISAPQVQVLDLATEAALEELGITDTMVRTSFQLRVGELLDTTLMQLMPIDFARALVDGLMQPTAPAPAPAAPGAEAPPAGAADDDRHLHALPAPPVAQPVTFPSLDDMPARPGGSDISLLLDVPLQVTVELGRTQLRIRNVLELVPGSIIELDKLAGEPVDVLVNGKPIARGEVVVIDEEFGVRITDVASQAKRLRGLAAEEA